MIEAQEIYDIVVEWLEKHGWERAKNKSMLYRKQGSEWTSFGDAMMQQMRMDGVDFSNKGIEWLPKPKSE